MTSQVLAGSGRLTAQPAGYSGRAAQRAPSPGVALHGVRGTSSVRPLGGASTSASRGACYPQPAAAAASCSALRSLPQHHVVAAAGLEAQEASPSTLMDLQMAPIINTQGFVQPEIPEGAAAAVFAVYDGNRKLQYIGFSKDLRSTLRTVLGRRPDKAVSYRAHFLPAVDQEAMVNIRDAWFEQGGGPPNGNKLALERASWQQPVDAGAISQRGKLGAAEERAKQLLQALKERGLKEEFVANTALLAEGQVDFLPSVALTPEQLAEQQAQLARSLASTRSATALVDGQARRYNVTYLRKFATNGGYMMDVRSTFEQQESTHRIIIGRDYYEPHGLEPEVAVEVALNLLLAKKLPRQTEGMLLSSEFPVNYFSMSELEQWFGDDFVEEFERTSGVYRDGKDNFWRFNRLFDYGATEEDPNSLNIAVGRSGSGQSF